MADTVGPPVSTTEKGAVTFAAAPLLWPFRVGWMGASKSEPTTGGCAD